MKAAIDTNVVVSGTFFGGAPADLLDAWEEGGFEWVVTPDILAEYARVLTAFSDDPDVQEIGIVTYASVSRRATIVEVIEPVTLSRDPDDDKFLSCAVASAAVVVSGDRDLLSCDGLMGIRVATPRRFLTMLARNE